MTESKKESGKTKVYKGDKKLAIIRIRRKSGELYLYIKTNNELESFFKTNRTNTSDIYHNGQPLEFYGLKHVLRDIQSQYGQNLREYGKELRMGMGYNFSLLRTKGISQGIELELTELLSKELIEDYIVNVKEFIKKLYRDYIKDLEVKTELEVKDL